MNLIKLPLYIIGLLYVRLAIWRFNKYVLTGELLTGAEYAERIELNRDKKSFSTFAVRKIVNYIYFDGNRHLIKIKEFQNL